MTEGLAMSSLQSVASVPCEVRTNSLCVKFPDQAEVTVAKAFEELSPFGDIARLEVPPGRQAAVVSYYDMRCAAKAAAALPDRFAQEEPQYGNRTVWLTGDVQLHGWMMPEIAGVQQGGGDLPGAGMYSIEFFDTRVAEKAQKQLQSAAATASASADEHPASARRPTVVIEQPPGLERRSGSSSAWPANDALLPRKIALGQSSSASAPRYHNDLRLSEVIWRDIDCGLDARTTLRLRCLPAKLCEEEAFHQCLRRGGLTKLVDCVRIFPGEGRRPGSALVNAVGVSGVKAVTKYFHGRQWGKSMPVAVSFAAVQGGGEVQKAFPNKTLHSEAHAAAQTGKAATEPWLIEATLCGEGDRVSEVSTEAGDDA